MKTNHLRWMRTDLPEGERDCYPSMYDCRQAWRDWTRATGVAFQHGNSTSMICKGERSDKARACTCTGS